MCISLYIWRSIRSVNKFAGQSFSPTYPNGKICIRTCVRTCAWYLNNVTVCFCKLAWSGQKTWQQYSCKLTTVVLVYIMRNWCNEIMNLMATVCTQKRTDQALCISLNGNATRAIVHSKMERSEQLTPKIFLLVWTHTYVYEQSHLLTTMPTV